MRGANTACCSCVLPWARLRVLLAFRDGALIQSAIAEQGEHQLRDMQHGRVRRATEDEHVHSRLGEL